LPSQRRSTPPKPHHYIKESEHKKGIGTPKNPVFSVPIPFVCRQSPIPDRCSRRVRSGSCRGIPCLPPA
jgi:hypothetical protein